MTCCTTRCRRRATCSKPSMITPDSSSSRSKKGRHKSGSKSNVRHIRCLSLTCETWRSTGWRRISLRRAKSIMTWCLSRVAGGEASEGLLLPSDSKLHMSESTAMKAHSLPYLSRISPNQALYRINHLWEMLIWVQSRFRLHQGQHLIHLKEAFLQIIKPRIKLCWIWVQL